MAYHAVLYMPGNAEKCGLFNIIDSNSSASYGHFFLSNFFGVVELYWRDGFGYFVFACRISGGALVFLRMLRSFFF